MEFFLKRIINILITFVVLVALTFFFKLSLYKELVQEDGIVEYLTAILLLILSIFVFYRVVKVKFSRGTAWFVFNIIMALGLFFGFGEEISWGQRIFSIESSEFFLEHNAQDEMNLHNLKVNGVKINKIIFSYGFSIVFGVYFLFLLFIYKKNEFLKSIVDKLGIPVPTAKQSVLFLVLSGIIFISSDGRKWELWECLFILFFFLIFLNPYNSREKLLSYKK